MKRLYTYIYILLTMCIGLLPLASCSDGTSPLSDNDPEQGETPYISIGLPRASNENSESTEQSSEDYETTIQSLAILQKDGNKARLIYRNDNLNKVMTDKDASFKIYKDNLANGTKFTEGLTLYAIANYTGSSNILNTLPALNSTVAYTTIENLATDDVSIIEETDNTKKNFVMSATATGADMSNGRQCYATMNMERVAVKVRLKLHLLPPTKLPNDWVFVQWAPGNELPFARTENKGGKGHLFQDIPLNGHTDNNDELYTYTSQTGSDEYHLMTKVSMSADLTSGEFTTIGYLYPRVWQTGDDKETYISLSVPYRFREKDDADNVYSDELYNYYKIRFADSEGNSYKLERNTFYDVDVTIKMTGNTNLDDAVKIDGHVVKLHDWHVKSGEISIENHYVEVENYQFDMVDQLSFDFSASEKPVFYFSLGEKNFSSTGSTIWKNYSYTIPYFTNNSGAINIKLNGSYLPEYTYLNFTGLNGNTGSKYENLTSMFVNAENPPGILPNFTFKTPYLIYGSIVSGKITKPLHIYQYPHVHFKVTNYMLDESKPIENNQRITSEFDYSTIVLHQGAVQYINSTSEVDVLHSYIAGAVAEETIETDTSGTNTKKYVVTYNQEDIQPYMARSFTVDKKDIKITQTASAPRYNLLYIQAVNACKKRQDEDRAKGYGWRIPTLREMRVMYEAKEALKFQSGYNSTTKVDGEPYLSSPYKEFANLYASDDNIPSNARSDGGTPYKLYYVFGTQPTTDNNSAFLIDAKDLAGWGAPWWTIKTVNQFMRSVESGKHYYVRCVRNSD